MQIFQPSYKSTQLNKAFHHAKQSTASMGMFEGEMKGEKKEKGVKRKFDPLLKQGEREEQMKLLKTMKKKGGINVTKVCRKKNYLIHVISVN